jgi:hypothetical protein
MIILISSILTEGLRIGGLNGHQVANGRMLVLFWLMELKGRDMEYTVPTAQRRRSRTTMMAGLC